MTERIIDTSLAPRLMARVSSALGKGAASRLERAWFAFRANGLRLRRALRDLGTREVFARTYADERAQLAAWPAIIGASRTPLWYATRADEGGAGAEWTLTAGKVENLRVAARRLHGLVIPAGTVFSFWHALGRPTRARGYVAGRELREGCMVASTGGGLCQLSNALYATALDAGMQIVERHAHSRIVPGSLAERGLDATVFWNYVDLRFRAPSDCVLDVRLDATHLHVRLRTHAPRTAKAKPVDQPSPRISGHAHDCVGCEQRDCVEYIAPLARAGHTAWLLDEVWPEFDRWLGKRARGGDQVLLPMDGKRRGRAAYAWSLPAGAIREHAVLATMRGLATRLLGAQGAARQRGLLRFDRMLADAYARKLSPEADRLVIALNLLPHLWQAGVLGGRHYTVLLNRSPLSLLHAQLDRAGALHPQSPTLGDFRADAALIAAEEAALQGAHALVTPHAAVAAHCRARYGAAVERLDWSMPAAHDARGSRTERGAVLFPASALGRKGAYVVRAACRALGLPVRVLGQASEGANFWSGVDAAPADRRDPWKGIACVVLPAFVEHRPRLLLQALARGLPVLCTAECGLPAGTPGVRIVRAGDEAELIAALAGVAV
ncbi:MAG: VanW family protein [Reyranellaceae bacterium]